MNDREVLDRLRLLSRDEELSETARAGIRSVLRDRARHGITEIGVLERRILIAAEECSSGDVGTDEVMRLVSLALRRLAIVHDIRK